MLTSIILLTLNNMDQTVRCVNSIRMLTHVPYELIVIDNGSTDGTIGWLYEQPDIRFVCNGSNAGFAASCNQGVALARGELLLLLNNDTLVSPRWLPQLQAALLSQDAVGIVGPVSNFVLPLQKRPFHYAGDDSFFRFADGFNFQDPGRWQNATSLSGFCMLLRRSTWDALGALDEQFAVGGYEDIDYGYRALRCGLSLRIAGDTFVYHEGNKSFDRNRMDMYAIARVNRRLFLRKWGFNPERLILQLDPGFLPGIRMLAHPHHEPTSAAVPGGWYGVDGSGCVYRVERGVKRPVASYESLLHLGMSMDRVALGADAILAGLAVGTPIRPLTGLMWDYPDSFLARDPGGGAHMIAYGIRYPIHDESSCRSLGLRPEEAAGIRYEQLHALPEGWPIRMDPWEEHELLDHRVYAGPDGRLFYGEGQRLRPIRSDETLRRYGWSRERAVALPPHVFYRTPVSYEVD
ncbi:glycosyltransferase family 2 protein [Cohnella fermenti]|uniref:Glycosyltransferase family 2 protein n=1 Tax=Cohnella fermenti TaxID=2565925 RepID=A0A4S4BGC8_9BACL|nr:glycosyltransferase family 2 protein [Cohnella fermenti]THF73369.1 glycosyltransferase family 2 protein [Cohnella fermenti]